MLQGDSPKLNAFRPEASFLLVIDASNASMGQGAVPERAVQSAHLAVVESAAQL